MYKYYMFKKTDDLKICSVVFYKVNYFISITKHCKYLPERLLLRSKMYPFYGCCRMWYNFSVIWQFIYTNDFIWPKEKTHKDQDFRFDRSRKPQLTIHKNYYFIYFWLPQSCYREDHCLSIINFLCFPTTSNLAN